MVCTLSTFNLNLTAQELAVVVEHCQCVRARTKFCDRQTDTDRQLLEENSQVSRWLALH